MSTQLEQDLENILTQKQSYLLPENIKNGITVLGVTGTLKEASKNLFLHYDTIENNQTNGFAITSTGYTYKRTNSGGYSSADTTISGLTAGATYTFSFKFNGANATAVSNTKIYGLPDVISFGNYSQDTLVSYTFQPSTTSITFSCITEGSTFNWVNLYNMMLNEGSTALAYEKP